MGCTVSGHERSSRPSLKEHNGQNSSNSSERRVFRVDSRHFLSERQLYSITKSWKGIARNMHDTGVNMFLRLFETNSELTELFSKLKKLRTPTDLRNSRALDAHALKVMSTLDEAFANLDDFDYVVSMLRKVGSLHSSFVGFNPDIFWKIEEPFMLAVKETLGDRFSTSIQATYRETIRFILQTLTEGFRSAAAPQQNGTTQQTTLGE